MQGIHSSTPKPHIDVFALRTAVLQSTSANNNDARQRDSYSSSSSSSSSRSNKRKRSTAERQCFDSHKMPAHLVAFTASSRATVSNDNFHGNKRTPSSSTPVTGSNNFNQQRRKSRKSSLDSTRPQNQNQPVNSRNRINSNVDHNGSPGHKPRAGISKPPIAVIDLDTSEEDSDPDVVECPATFSVPKTNRNASVDRVTSNGKPPSSPAGFVGDLHRHHQQPHEYQQEENRVAAASKQAKASASSRPAIQPGSAAGAFGSAPKAFSPKFPAVRQARVVQTGILSLFAPTPIELNARTPFFSRFSPLCYKDILQWPVRKDEIRSWISSVSKSTTHFGTAFVQGPTGSGKKTALELMLRDQGYQVVEMGCNDVQHDTSVAAYIERLFDNVSNKLAVIVDGIEGVAELQNIWHKVGKGERSWALELHTLFRRWKHGTLNRIVFFTCVDCADKSVRLVRNACHKRFKWLPPKTPDLIERLCSVCLKEGVSLSTERAKTVTQQCRGDIRVALGMALWPQSSKADTVMNSFEFADAIVFHKLRNSYNNRWKRVPGEGRVAINRTETGKKTAALTDIKHLPFSLEQIEAVVYGSVDIHVGVEMCHENYLDVPVDHTRVTLDGLAKLADAFSQVDAYAHGFWETGAISRAPALSAITRTHLYAYDVPWDDKRWEKCETRFPQSLRRPPRVSFASAYIELTGEEELPQSFEAVLDRLTLGAILYQAASDRTGGRDTDEPKSCFSNGITTKKKKYTAVAQALELLDFKNPGNALC